MYNTTLLCMLEPVFDQNFFSRTKRVRLILFYVSSISLIPSIWIVWTKKSFHFTTHHRFSLKMINRAPGIPMHSRGTVNMMYYEIAIQLYFQASSIPPLHRNRFKPRNCPTLCWISTDSHWEQRWLPSLLFLQTLTRMQIKGKYQRPDAFPSRHSR